VLVAGHSNAFVGKSQKTLFLIHCNCDAELSLAVASRLQRKHGVTDLFECVARVGDQLAQKDFAVWIQGVLRDIEQLPCFYLQPIASALA